MIQPVLRWQRSFRHAEFVSKVGRRLFWLTSQYKRTWLNLGPGTLDTQRHTGQGDLPGLGKGGQLDRVLDAMMVMDQQGVVPSVDLYSSLIKACAETKSLPQAKRVLAHLTRHGLVSTRFLGEYMVNTLVKCGGLEDALQVFDRLPYRTVFSWTAIISGYTMSGRAQEALRMYRWMQVEGVIPNTFSFVSLLKACGNLEDLEEGKRIHAEAVKFGCESDLFVGTCLIGMYAKCGSIGDAQYVFDGLSQRNVVSWTAILAAYIQQGQAQKVLELYEEMQEEGVNPDERTFLSVSQACGMLGENEKGQDIAANMRCCLKYVALGKALHAYIWRRGYLSDVFISSTLVSMYVKCGSIPDAEIVFDRLSERNVVAWTAMLGAYSQENQAGKALQLYEQMQEEGVSPDLRSSVTVLKVCGVLAETDQEVVNGRSTKMKFLEWGKSIHAHATRKKYVSDIFFRNTLISMYSKCGSILDAQTLFDCQSQHDIVSWNVMLSAYVEHGHAEDALQLYQKLWEEGMSPDALTFVSTLQACGLLAEKEEEVMVDGQLTRAKCMEKGKAINAYTKIKGCDSNVFVGNTLISMYGKLGSIIDARNVFDGLSQLSVVSWNAMLAAYTQQGLTEKAFQLYKEMDLKGVDPDEMTLVCILEAGSSTGGLDICRQVHCNLASLGHDLNPVLANTLIHAYGRCASMVDAQSVFDALRQPDVASWTALIAGYARQGNFAASLQLYMDMQVANIRPDGVTFLSLLTACSHAGFVDKGMQYFESMSGDHGITPEIQHYVCLVDLLGRAGYFSRVQDLFLNMPMQPNLSMWLCLLASCRKHGEVALGKLAFNCAVALEPRHAAPYVLMSNIYKDAGLLDCAREVNEMEQAAGGWKKPCGKSWIEHETEIHAFVVEDLKLLGNQEVLDFVRKVKFDLSEKGL